MATPEGTLEEKQKLMEGEEKPPSSKKKDDKDGTRQVAIVNCLRRLCVGCLVPGDGSRLVLDSLFPTA